jgi:uncharacterized metal-binding protein
MPDYATHQKINSIVLTVAIVTIIMMWIDGKIELSGSIIGFPVAFIISSWVLTPDLDTRSIPFYRWGYARIVWITFQKFSKHRGILHNPVFSPILLCFPLIILHWELGLKYELLWIYAGITVQIWAHIASDWIMSWKKEKMINII